MKIPKELYSRLATLEREILKLFDHTVALLFVSEDEASFCSMDGKDRNSYTVFRQPGEVDAEFQKRAKMQTRQKFPKATLNIFSHELCKHLSDLEEPRHRAAVLNESEISRRYSEKIRKDIEARRARRASEDI